MPRNLLSLHGHGTAASLHALGRGLRTLAALSRLATLATKNWQITRYSRAATILRLVALMLVLMNSLGRSMALRLTALPQCRSKESTKAPGVAPASI